MAAFPTDGGYTSTNLAEYIGEVWSLTINDFYRSKLGAANHFLNMSGDLSGGGDIIHLPVTTEYTATTKSDNQAVAINSGTETSINLTVKTWKESSFGVPDSEASQVMASYNIQKIYISNAAYACAKSLDTALMALYSGLDHNVNDSASAVADADILAAMQSLDDHDVPAEDRMFFFKPSIVWGDIMTLDRFVHYSEMGQESMNGGRLGVLYGVPVMSTNQVATTHTDFVHNLLAHKDAFAWASRPLPGAAIEPNSGKALVRLQSNYIPDHLTTLSTADIIYGVIENIDGGAVEIRAIT